MDYPASQGAVLDLWSEETMKYGNNQAENAYDHAHSMQLKGCLLCQKTASNGHHFSRLSEDECYYLCDDCEVAQFGYRMTEY